jgi:hypothetical protein
MGERLAEDVSSPEFEPVLPLPRSEFVDFKLLSIVAQAAEVEQWLTPTDFGRVPSLRELVETARAVASELGYGD